MITNLSGMRSWMFTFLGCSTKISGRLSTGFAAQFKGARAWRLVGQYPSLTDRIRLTGSYFGTGHGKGEHDGAGTSVKSELCNEQPKKQDGAKLTCAQYVVAWLSSKISAGAVSTFASRQSRVHKEFWLIGQNDVNVMPMRIWEFGSLV